MTWKSYAIVSGAGVIATYIASGTERPIVKPATPQQRTESVRPAAAIDIEEQAAHLQARIRAQAAYQEPARNPFRFSARQEVRRAVSSAPATAIAPLQVAPVRQLPVIALVGVASDEVDGVMQRTAILSTSQGVLLVREGDAVGVDYKVAKVEDGAIELVAPADSSVRRISFKP